MFNDCVRITPFTSSIADEVFRRIGGLDYKGDVSFVSTMRALLYPRTADIRITQQYDSLGYSSGVYDSNSMGSILSAEFGGSYANLIADPDSIPDERIEVVILYISSNEEAAFRCLDEYYNETLSPHYESLEKLQIFYKAITNTRFFVSNNHQMVIVALSKMSYGIWHELQCSIPVFLEYYFKNSPLDEDELALIHSLGGDSSREYLNCLGKLIKRYDLRKEALKILDNFEEKQYKVELRSIRQDIDELDREISEYLDNIHRYIQKKNMLSERAIGVNERIASSGGKSEIQEYFSVNKKIIPIATHASSLIFVVMDYCEFYDEDQAEKAIENHDSYIYESFERNYRESAISKEGMALLMKTIFLDKKIKLRFCAEYSLNLAGYVSVSDHGDYSDFMSYMPNPHIFNYACLGNYEAEINEILENHDYVGAIEQCIASCKSLNFGDYPVMSKFMDVMYNVDNNVNRRCLELPDGNVVTPEEALKWIENTQEGEN